MLSLIIPCYRADGIIANSLPALRNYLQQHDIPHEIIVVDDGSRDSGSTRRIAEREGCRFMENPVNSGKGAAVRRGMLAAQGSVCIFTDADIPFGFASVEQFYNVLSRSDFDIAIGDRTLNGSTYASAIPLKRAFASACFRALVGRSLTSAFPDTQCGLKGFKRQVVQELFPFVETNGFAFDVELLYRVLDRRLKVKRLPVKLQNHGETSVRLLKHGPQMLRDLARLRWRRLRGSGLADAPRETVGSERSLAANE